MRRAAARAAQTETGQQQPGRLEDRLSAQRVAESGLAATDETEELMGAHRTRHRQPARRRLPGRAERLAHSYGGPPPQRWVPGPMTGLLDFPQRPADQLRASRGVGYDGGSPAGLRRRRTGTS